MITDRKISLFRLDAHGNKQLTRVLFEVETHEHILSKEFVWLKVEDPTQEEMSGVINKLLKPELEQNMKGYDIDLLVKDLERDYFLQKNHLLQNAKAFAV